MSQRLPPLGEMEHRPAHESVVEAVRRAILGGVLPEGTRLVQAELAGQFGVSNTPVREALRQLSAEGLIRFDPYRGAVVHSPTLDEVREVYELRLLLEPVAIRRTVDEASSTQLEHARQLQQEMVRTDDVGEWVLLNRRFHGVLIEAARSPRLAGIVAGLENAATPQVALSIRADLRRMTDGNQEHHELLHAVERRDAERAVELVSSHLRSTVRAIESRAENSADAAASS